MGYAGFIDGCKYRWNGRGLSIGTKCRPTFEDDIGDATETTVVVRVEPACTSFPWLVPAFLSRLKKAARVTYGAARLAI
jgi:hypothetical protein